MKLQAQVNIIETIAGTDSLGFCCDGNLAVNAKLNFPQQLCVDYSGGLYIADAGNNRIRKIVLATGIITTVAGNGTLGYSGDGNPATDAQLAIPSAVCVDMSGNIYIGDALNSRIRKVDISTGIISTVAGNGLYGNSGDGGPATSARIKSPVGLTLDNSGNLYIADADNNNIRKVSPAGIITTVAGNGTLGYSGDGGPATNAKFNSLGDIGVDGFGNIVIGDIGNHAVRKVDALTGIITTIAGNGNAGYSGDGGLSVNAEIKNPYGVFIDKHNNIFFAEWGNGVIRKIDGVTNIISTVVGYGVQGFAGDGGLATNAQLKPDDVFLDSLGTIYIADYSNHRIRRAYNPYLGTTSSETPSAEVSLYPNPFNDELTVEYNFSSNTDAALQITDATGKVILTSVLQGKNQKETVNTKTLAQGLYFYRVIQDNAPIVTGKVIRQ